ncbi:MAG: BTAD domain-containing putative transcriptional regulator, partial [Phenylobacterium sp.]
ADCGAPDAIRRTVEGYLLDRSAVEVDADTFRVLVGEAHRLSRDDPAAALIAADEALALWRGPAFGEIRDEEFIQGEAERLTGLWRDVVEVRLAALVELGIEGLVPELEAAVADTPLRERRTALLMIALYRAGRQAEALAVYEDLRRHLDDDLGLDPGPAIRAVHTQILRQDSRIAMPPGRHPGATPVPEPALQPDQRPRTGLVGRSLPLQQLSAALDAAAGGSGSLWLISGEAGIGKTTLCQELAVRAGSAGVETVWARSQETAADIPFWPWVQVLQSLPDAPLNREIGVLLGTADPLPGLAPAQTRARSYAALVKLLLDRATTAALLLIVEDLHWADEASLEVFSLLVEQIPNGKLMLVATHRPEDVDPGAPLGALLARVARSRATNRIELTGLTRAEIRELISSRMSAEPAPELVDIANDRTDGNPFFLTELLEVARTSPDVSAVWLELPHSVRDVLARRLSQLGPGTRTLLQAAAVIGRDADLAVLEEVAVLTADDLDGALAEAGSAGLITERLWPRPGIRFVHALTREVLYSQLRPLVRAKLHSRIGGVLSASADAAEQIEARAQHLAAGAPLVEPAVAVDALLRAERRATSRTAFEQAVQLCRQSLELIAGMPASAERDRWELTAQSRLGSQLATIRGWAAPETTAAFTAARELAISAEPDADVCAALYGLSAALVVSSQFNAAQELGNDLIRIAAQGGPYGAAWNALGHWVVGGTAWHLGNYPDAVRALERSAAGVGALAGTTVGQQVIDAMPQDPEATIHCFLSSALMMDGQRPAAFAALDHARSRAESIAQPVAVCSVHWFTALAYFMARDHRSTLAEAQLAQNLARQYGFALWTAMATILAAWARAVADE